MDKAFCVLNSHRPAWRLSKKCWYWFVSVFLSLISSQKEQHGRWTQRRRAGGPAWRRALLLSLPSAELCLKLCPLTSLCSGHCALTLSSAPFPSNQRQYRLLILHTEETLKVLNLIHCLFWHSDLCAQAYFHFRFQSILSYPSFSCISCSTVEILATVWSARLLVLPAQPLTVVTGIGELIRGTASSLD